MDVKIEEEIINDGETIENHRLVANTIDTFNLYSLAYCVIIFLCFLRLLWVFSVLWKRTKPMKKD